jgi:hypothetical protein
MTVVRRLALLAGAFALFPFPLSVRAAATTMPVCSPGDPVVWVNTHSHVYHLQGDAYFGKTKAGEYACESKAVASGAHQAGSSKKSSATAVATPAAPESATPSPAPKKKHHHKVISSPAPLASP